MDGIINVIKPTGMTSFDVVRKVKKITGEKKIGHTGTLDPLAEGVLPICLGKGTKITNYIMNGEKTYEALIKLGITTDTYDREGTVVANSDKIPSKEDIEKIIFSFIGDIYQVPPMYSALKHNGERLYDLARKGITVERPKRLISIFDIRIKSLEFPFVNIVVRCSKGTYIRSLCYDIGESLGTGATIWNLNRLASGIFKESSGILLSLLTKENYRDHCLKIEDVLMDYPKLFFNKAYEKPLLNGVTLKNINYLKIEEGVTYRVYLEEKFIGIGSLKEEGFKIDLLLI